MTIQKAAKMSKLSMIIVIVATLIVITTARMSKCRGPPPKFPPNPAPSDDRFYITVANNIKFYVPGETYNVTLHSVFNEARPNRFTGFHIYAEISEDEEQGTETAGPGTILQIPGDTSTKFSERCTAIKEANTLPKTEVMVMWKAPLQGSGCIFIRAQVTEYYNVWYDAVGPLSKKLCENEREYLYLHENYRLDKCEACDEAKYEIVFQGSWSQNTHPRDFPEMNWLTRFSDLIGASHTSEYQFWRNGQQASEGLKQFAEFGYTKILEEEIQSEFGEVRTLIKGKGHNYPDLEEPTYAIARVDSKHHLISAVINISPSPDWFLGVAGLELCLQNKSWVESRELNLYPWDAGTDSGISYMSSDQQTVPQEAISSLELIAPHDERSPFYGSEMKPFGTLYVNRVKVFPKECEEEEGKEDDANEEKTDESETENKQKPEPGEPGARSCENCSASTPTEEPDEECVLTEWGPWTPCNPTCGPQGMRFQRRRFKLKSEGKTEECKAKTVNYETCDNPECSSDSTHSERYTNTKYDFLTGDDIPTKFYYKKRSSDLHPMSLLQEPQSLKSTPQRMNCSVSPWSEWSSCSRTCGTGIKEKRRHFIHGSTDECPQKLIKFKSCRLRACP